MLQVGNGGMRTTEYRAHMSMWALLNAPLIAGNDLRSMDSTTRDILTNPEVIAVDQVWAGVGGEQIADDGDLQIWAKPMSQGGAAVVLFNGGRAGAEMATSADDLDLPDGEEYDVRDVWAHTTAVTAGAVSARVPPHGATMLVVSPR